MTNVWKRPEKADIRRRLFQIAEETLKNNGWEVEKIPRFGKSSVRRIRKGTESQVVSIRTTQDQWIAFPRNAADDGWVTLSDVDAVVAVSVDDRDAPQYAQVHMLEGGEMRDRFDRAYQARKAAHHSVPLGRGVWVSLYTPEAKHPVSLVGAGAGLDHPPIARVPLEPADGGSVEVKGAPGERETEKSAVETTGGREDEPLTIGEAKRRLAISLGVDPANIKILVEA
jgi:hypothetical protein